MPVREGNGPFHVNRMPPTGLTPREKEILALVVADELSNQQIAEQLCITGKTLDTHLQNMRDKLGVRSRVGMVKWAMAHD